MHTHHEHGGRDWDEFYATEGGGQPLWSGRPNATMVAEVANLTPGTALDVGCGEGADAIWLAGQGWQVTAVDPSRVALERADAAARDVGVEVRWVHSGLLEMTGGPGAHDLVSAQYAVLPGDEAATRTLLDAVAPGGTLLVVHHDLDPAHASTHRFDRNDHLLPADIADHLDDGWTIEVHETRARPDPPMPGTDHVRDVVLRAVRVGR